MQILLQKTKVLKCQNETNSGMRVLLVETFYADTLVVRKRVHLRYMKIKQCWLLAAWHSILFS